MSSSNEMNKTLTDELLPCPFCGGSAYWRNTTTEGYVSCNGRCDVKIIKRHSQYTNTDGVDSAITAWNTRYEESKNQPQGDLASVKANAKILYEKLLPFTEGARKEVNEAYFAILMDCNAALQAMPDTANLVEEKEITAATCTAFKIEMDEVLNGKA